MKLPRRTILGAGAAGLGSLWLPSLNSARAQDNDASPLKVLILYGTAGWTTRHMDMRPPWAPPEWSEYNIYDTGKFQLVPDDLEFEFELTDPRLKEEHFSRVLKPLFRHRDQLLVTEGLACLSTAFDKNGDAHAQQHIAVLSGTPSAEKIGGNRSKGSTPSVDQRINEHIQKTDPLHQSLDYSLRIDNHFHTWLYRSDGLGGAAALPVEKDPLVAFDRLLGANISDDPLSTGAASTIDMAMRHYQRLAPKMSSEDRLKLEAHRELLGELRVKLGRTVSCDSPTRPSDFASKPGKLEFFNVDIPAFTKLIATGLGCGLSRVATLGSVTAPNSAFGLDESVSMHHEYEHPSSPFKFYNGKATDETVHQEEMMVRRNVVQMESFANVLDQLRETPHAGGSLLDSTLVLYISELAHGNHGGEHMPVLIAGGGASGVVRPGRYVKYAQNNPNPWGRNYYNEYTGTPYGRMLVWLLQSFGIDIDYMHAPSIPGEVPHAGIKGDVNLSGPLHGIA